MKIGNFRRLSMEDFREAPPWMERVFDLLNEFIEAVSTAIQGHISLLDNLEIETREIELNHNVSTVIELQDVRNPIGGLMIHTDYFEHGDFVIETIGGDKVRVNAEWQADPGRPVNCRLIIFGGE